MGEDSGGIRPGQIHFIDKQKDRDMIAFQQLPDSFGVTLHAVRSADYQNGIVQHLHGALGFCGKVYVSGGVQERICRILIFQHCLMCKMVMPRPRSMGCVSKKAVW